jgi:hypothetical protein
MRDVWRCIRLLSILMPKMERGERVLNSGVWFFWADEPLND